MKIEGKNGDVVVRVTDIDSMTLADLVKAIGGEVVAVDLIKRQLAIRAGVPIRDGRLAGGDYTLSEFIAALGTSGGAPRKADVVAATLTALNKGKITPDQAARVLASKTVKGMADALDKALKGKREG